MILQLIPVSPTKNLSVIVVNWNRRELLDRCLRSLAAQTVNHFQVVLVDNGSTDGSADWAEKNFGESPKFHLLIVRNRENRGFCAANNQGISAASDAELVALLNNDAEADPQWLEALSSAFERPEIGMAASKILVYEDPGKIDKVGHLIYLDGQNRGRGTGQRDTGQFDRVEEVLWPDGCAAMYRREMLEQVGGFDEDFFAYADDADLGLRGRIAGWRCLYVPGAVVRHHRGATLGILSARRLELIERNRILLATKLFPWSLLCLNSVYHAARIASGMWATLRGKGEASRFPGWTGKWRIAAALMRGTIQGWMMAPRMLRKRRQISKYRRLSPSQTRRLILQHRINLKELSEQAI